MSPYDRPAVAESALRIPKGANAASAPQDPSGVAWVHDELRRSLESAHKLLRRHLRETESHAGSDVSARELGGVRQALSLIHQAAGALSLVGSEAAARVLDASDAALRWALQRPTRVDAALVDKIEQASFAVIDWLGRMKAGRPVSALLLFPQMRALLETAGAERIHPADLWSRNWQFKLLPVEPDIQLRPVDTRSLTALEQLTLANIKTPSPLILARISDFYAGVAAASGPNAGDLQAVWQLAAAVFEALAKGLLTEDVFNKRLGSRLLSLLRSVQRGQDIADEATGRLAHDLLFFCCQARPEAGALAPRLTVVRAAYALDDEPIVDYSTSSLGRFDPALVVQARKRVQSAKLVWSAVIAGEMLHISGLVESFSLLADSLRRMFADGAELAEQLEALAVRCAADGAAPGVGVAMEVATALLYVEAAIEDAGRPGTGPDRPIERLAQRIAAARESGTAQPLESWIEELYGRVAGQQTQGTVVQELRHSMTAAEQQLDRFFRDPSDRDALATVPKLLQSVHGVLHVLGVEQAAQAVQHMRREIEALIADPLARPAPARLERLAGNVGMLGFLFDMLGVQPALARTMFRFDAGTERLVAKGERQIDRMPTVAAVTAAPAAVTPAVEQAPVEPAAAAEASSPADASLQPVPVPTAADAAPFDVDDDPELQAIFGEEATELLATARNLLGGWRIGSDDAFSLVELRRVFHTLKGSARMVGRGDVGELAWEAEQRYSARALREAEPPADEQTDAADTQDDVRLREWTSWTVERIAQALGQTAAAAGDGATGGVVANEPGVAEQTLPLVESIPRPDPGDVVDLDITVPHDLDFDLSWIAEHGTRVDAGKPPVQLAEDDWLDEAMPLPDASETARPLGFPADLPSADDLDLDLDFDLQSATPREPGATLWGDSLSIPDTVPAPAPKVSTEINVEDIGRRFTRAPVEMPDLSFITLDLSDPKPADPSPRASDAAPADDVEPADSSGADQIGGPVSASDPVVAHDDSPEAGAVDSPPPVEDARLEITGTLPTDIGIPAIDAPLADAPPASDEVQTGAPAAADAEAPVGAKPDQSDQAAWTAEPVVDQPPNAWTGPAVDLSTTDDLPRSEVEPGDAAAPSGEDASTDQQQAPQPPGWPIEPAPDQTLAALDQAPSASDETPPVDMPPAEASEPGWEEPLTNWEPPPQQQPAWTAEPAADQTPPVADQSPPASTEVPPVDAPLGEAPAPSWDRTQTNWEQPQQPAWTDEPAADQTPPVSDQSPPAMVDTPLADVPPSWDQPPAADAPVADWEYPQQAAPADLPGADQSPPAWTEAPTADLAPPASDAAAATEPQPSTWSEVSPPSTPEPPPTRQIGPLTVPVSLFNIFLNEADELSRQLCSELAEWSMQGHLPIPPTAVERLHALIGSSATVGYSALGELARELEAALLREQQVTAGGGARDAVDPLLFSDVAEEIRQLLHQFAAGFLRSPSVGLLQRLADFQQNSHRRMQPLQEAHLAPIDHAAGRTTPDTDWLADIRAVDRVEAELFPIFEEEAHDLLPQLAASLRDWARQPDQLASAHAAMRHLHTFKGGARLAGAMRLGELAHRLETRIEALTVDQSPVRGDAIESLRAGSDALQHTFEALRESDARAHAAGGARSVAVAPSAMPWQTTSQVAADELPVRPVVDWSRFRRSGPVANPSASRLGAVTGQATIKVRASLLERMVNQAGEVNMSRARIEVEMGQVRSAMGELGDNIDRLRQQLHDFELQAETQMTSRSESARTGLQPFDALEIDRFTRLQELTRMIAESVNDVATVQRSLKRNVQRTEDELAAQTRLTRDLQSDLLRTRMVEFDTLAERLHRVVRQTAKEYGKQVELQISDGNIELDRSVLDRLTPVLEHLLRNGVIHGIEAPEQRSWSSKPPGGQLQIQLHQHGNEVGIDVIDDGAGLDLARIRARAEAMGRWLAEGQETELIFSPGFSTAATLTEMAGRGVGLDVVRNELAALDGQIEVTSSPGHGCRFSMQLPLTTAMTQVLMLRCGDLTVAVPATMVEQVRRISEADLAAALADGFYLYGDLMLPMYWLGALLGYSTDSAEPFGRSRPLVIVHSGKQRLALRVDETLGQQEAVIRHLGPQLSRIPGLVGMSMLASGSVALIYNPLTLAAEYGPLVRSASLPRQQPRPPLGLAPSSPLVLVVDDSLTVRRVTQRLLLREGYRVALAKDGIEALERIEQELPGVVLSDIEMPRMDGYELVGQLRSAPRTQALPVVMITSRIADRHRVHAESLGVARYLGKPYTEEDLLTAVADCLKHPMPSA